jgi:hypothetical protein
MPWTVDTTSTPLWADSKRTLKKGLVANGTAFAVASVEFVKDKDMAKTDQVKYTRKGDGMIIIGDGWIELDNCVSVWPTVPPYMLPESDEEIAIAFLQQLRDALNVVLDKMT